GSADGLLKICDTVWEKGERKPLDEQWKQRILDANTHLAETGIRVLGVAFRIMDSERSDVSVEQGLTFVGLAGMIDPPRLEVRAAVDQCKTAGIRPVMITGDHPLTAAAIANELGIARETNTISGEQLQTISDEELVELAGHTAVYA